MNVVRAQEAWLATFADLAALLLAFFVMTFSMATMEKKAVKVVTVSEQGIGEPDEMKSLITDFVQLTVRLDNETKEIGIRDFLIQQRLSDLVNSHAASAERIADNLYLVDVDSLDSSLMTTIKPVLDSLDAQLVVLASSREAARQLRSMTTVAWTSADILARGAAPIAMHEVPTNALPMGKIGLAVRSVR